MKEEFNGWVIVSTENHPSGEKPRIFSDSFAQTRKQAIKNFCSGVSQDWNYWKNEYGFKCVKAKSTIQTV